MSAWSGWLGDMISGLGIPNTADNRAFLLGWAQYSSNPCRNNPLGSTLHRTGSTDCKSAPGGLSVQAYATRASAISATKARLSDGNYPELWGDLKTGHPLDQSFPDVLVENLQLWGADGWAQQVADKTGVKLNLPDSKAPAHVSTAWTRLMRTLAHRGPDAHNRIRHAAARANRIAR